MLNLVYIEFEWSLLPNRKKIQFLQMGFGGMNVSWQRNSKVKQKWSY